MTLDDKAWNDSTGRFYDEKDIKEFIKELKEDLISGKIFPRSDIICERIDRKVGDRLI